MGEARAEITIDRPADEVWATIGNFGELTWMPGVETCVLEGDDRILGMLGMRIVERQFSRDDEARTLTYGIVDGDMKPEVHEATITVMPAGGGSFVTWDVRDRRRDGRGDAGCIRRCPRGAEVTARGLTFGSQTCFDSGIL